MDCPACGNKFMKLPYPILRLMFVRVAAVVYGLTTMS